MHGKAQSVDGTGVVGNASANPLTPIDEPVGVYGHTDRTGEDSNVIAGYGVIGYANPPDGSTGTAHGVAGWTTTDDTESAGVFSLDDVRATRDVRAGGDAEINGDVRAGGDAEIDGTVYANADGDRTSRVYFGDSSNPPGRLVHDNTEDSFSLSTMAKSGATFEVKMDMELNQDGTTQRTAGPLAKGYVSSSGSLSGAVNVDSVSWDSNANRYKISLTNITYTDNDYVTTVTASDAVAAGTGSSTDDALLVSFADDSQHDFQFVTHDLP
jgi:hypothetical protein